jgi:acylphosphatase
LSTVQSASLRAVVRGRVQGVFFRAFARRWAYQLKLNGYVRNLPNGDVEVVAEGEKPGLEKLLEYLKEGPPASQVAEVAEEWGEAGGSYPGFSVMY